MNVLSVTALEILREVLTECREKLRKNKGGEDA